MSEYQLRIDQIASGRLAEFMTVGEISSYQVARRFSVVDAWVNESTAITLAPGTLKPSAGNRLDDYQSHIK